jgi:hypothetical protein
MTCHCEERSDEAIQLPCAKKEERKLDCFASLAMTSEYTSAFSPRVFARGLPETSALEREGAGNAGRAMRPQPGGQKRVEVLTSSRHHGHTGITRHSPRNGFNGFLRALPGDQDLLTPSLADNSTDLTPTSRRQDHTTSPSASSAFVKGAICVHRIPPRVRDDREPPLCVGRDGVCIKVIWVRRQVKF